MIDEEIMNTAVAKHDARKLKDLIQKIDGVPRGSTDKSSAADKFTSDKNSGGSAGDALTNSGNFKTYENKNQESKSRF